MMLGSHILSWRQTCQQIRRLANARRAPLLQFKQSMGIAVLQKRFKSARKARPVLARKPNLPLSLKRRRLGRQRCCGAKVVSLTLGDTYINSRWWLTSHRQNLYSDEDHLRPAISLVLPDRRDKFEEFNSLLLVLQHFPEDKQPASPLLAKGHSNQIRAKSGVRSRRVDRSSSRLPVFGNVTHVALWGGFR